MKGSQEHRAHVGGDMPHVETSNIVLFFRQTINFAFNKGVSVANDLEAKTIMLYGAIGRKSR